jgi:hypothetical protein
MGTTAYKKYLQHKNTFENILTGINKEEKNNFISNPVWGSKVGRLKKVKDRLKNFIR